MAGSYSDSYSESDSGSYAGSSSSSGSGSAGAPMETQTYSRSEALQGKARKFRDKGKARARRVRRNYDTAAHRIATIGKGIIGAVVPHAARGMAAWDAGKCAKHTAELTAAKKNKKCSCTDSTCERVLEYARNQLVKKGTKAVTTAATPFPTVTTGVKGAGGGGRKAYKRARGTLGVTREKMAEDLFYGCEDECPLGVRIVEILVGELWAKDIQDEGDFDDYKQILMRHLASS